LPYHPPWKIGFFKPGAKYTLNPGKKANGKLAVNPEKGEKKAISCVFLTHPG
jgi:hypothetical protein